MSIQSALRAFTRRREEFRRAGLKVESLARPVLQAIRKEGDRAVFRYTQKWDRVKLKSLRVSTAEMKTAEKKISAEDRDILEKTADRFRKFYETQNPRAPAFTDATGFYSERLVPLDRAGLYVPGGRAPLISTLLMLSIPAEIAGVKERYVATPPSRDGTIPPMILAAASIANVTAVFKMGGAQAIGAFAYGTRTVPRVDKIFGPGNAYVTAAKKLVFGETGIDLLAGPSELVLIADDSADPELVSEDLLAQAEHGPDSVSLLLTVSRSLASSVRKLLDKSLSGQIFVVVLKSIQECVSAASEVAPEHLTLNVAEPEKWVSSLGPAGAIFLGRTAVAHGDYVAGPNHTLPTSGAARYSSPLSVEAFMRRSSVLLVRDPSGELTRLGAALADREGLSHHARSLRLRLGDRGGEPR